MAGARLTTPRPPSARDRLTAAAAALYVARGAAGVTTRAVAARAGLNPVTVFRVFGTRRRLLVEALAAVGRGGPLPAPLPDAPADPPRELAAWAAWGAAFAARPALLARLAAGGAAEVHAEVRAAEIETLTWLWQSAAADLATYLRRLGTRVDKSALAHILGAPPDDALARAGPRRLRAGTAVSCAEEDDLTERAADLCVQALLGRAWLGHIAARSAGGEAGQHRPRTRPPVRVAEPGEGVGAFLRTLVTPVTPDRPASP